jgi:hypothetical protein
MEALPAKYGSASGEIAGEFAGEFLTLKPLGNFRRTAGEIAGEMWQSRHRDCRRDCRRVFLQQSKLTS